MEFKRIKNLLFFESIKLAKSNPSKIGIIILFDISFLLSFYYILPFFGQFVAKNLRLTQEYLIIFLLVLSQIYALLVLFIYSFFKYCVLDFVKSFFSKTEFSFNRFGSFYLLNLILIIPPYLMFNLILVNVKEAYRQIVLASLGSLVFLLLYLIVNLSHSFFYQGFSIKKSISKSFDFVFTKFKYYLEIILVIVLFVIILLVSLFSGIKLIEVFANDTPIYSIGRYFRQFIIVIFDLILYFVILINRISFYQITKKISIKA